eukprot:3794361-Pyramimonas_sp.AAC.2
MQRGKSSFIAFIYLVRAPVPNKCLQILEDRAQLFFHLQQQRLIELIRAGNVEEALEFAQEYLAPRGEENVRDNPHAMPRKPHRKSQRSCPPAARLLDLLDRVVEGALLAAFLEELERTVALLAFEDTANSPVG